MEKGKWARLLSLSVWLCVWSETRCLRLQLSWHPGYKGICLVWLMFLGSFHCDGEVGTVGDRSLYVNKYMGIHLAWCEGKSTIRGIQFTSSNFFKWVSSYYYCCAVYSWLGGLPVDSNSLISNSHLNIGVLCTNLLHEVLCVCSEDWTPILKLL